MANFAVANECDIKLIEVSYDGAFRWFDEMAFDHTRPPAIESDLIWLQLVQELPANIRWVELADWVDPAMAPIDLRDSFWKPQKLLHAFGIEDHKNALGELRNLAAMLVRNFRSPNIFKLLQEKSADELEEAWKSRREELNQLGRSTEYLDQLLAKIDVIRALLEPLPQRPWSRLQVLDLFTRSRLLLFSSDPELSAAWTVLEGPPHFHGFNRLGLGENRWSIRIFFSRLAEQMRNAFPHWRQPISVLRDQVVSLGYLLRSIFWNANYHFPALNLDTVSDIITLQTYSEFRAAPSLIGKPLIPDRKSSKILLTMDLPRVHQDEMLEMFRTEIESRELSRPIRVREDDGDSVRLDLTNLDREHLIRIEERARELHNESGLPLENALRMIFHSEALFRAYRDALEGVLKDFWLSLEEKRSELRSILYIRLDEAFTKLWQADRALSSQRINWAFERSFDGLGSEISERDENYNERRWRRDLRRQLLKQRKEAAKEFAELFIQADIMAAIFNFSLDENHRRAFFHPSVHRIAVGVLLREERRFSRSTRESDQAKRQIVLEFAGRFSSDPDNISTTHNPEDLQDDLIQQLGHIGPLKPVAALLQRHGKTGIILLFLTSFSTWAVQKGSDLFAHWLDERNNTPPIVQADESLRILDLIHPVYTPTEEEFFQKLGRYNNLVQYRGFNLDDLTQIRRFFDDLDSQDWPSDVRDRLKGLKEKFSTGNINVIIGAPVRQADLDDLNYLVFCLREWKLRTWGDEQNRLRDIRNLPETP